ncbi:hypothetical protein [Anatilimnocola aggregata]|nr:hypothetical protein [Anatilimnocola aggregata]
MIQQAQAQIAAAQTVLSAAESQGGNAQTQLTSSLSKMQQATDAFKQAHETEHGLLKELTEIEHEILGEQSVDTPYGRAATEIAQAKRELASIKAQLLSQSDVSTKLIGLKGVALTTAANEVLESHQPYLFALLRVRTAGREIDDVRTALFRADEDWRQTSEALTQVRQDIDSAKQQAIVTGFARMKPLHEYRKASDAAAAARTVIAQAEGVLQSLNATNKPPAASSKKK